MPESHVFKTWEWIKIAQISLFSPIEPQQNSGGCLNIFQRSQPFGKWNPTLFSFINFDFKRDCFHKMTSLTTSALSIMPVTACQPFPTAFAETLFWQETGFAAALRAWFGKTPTNLPDTHHRSEVDASNTMYRYN